MSYLVLARKWRPRTFDKMVGQEFISRTLKNAVQTDHVAHAFLFSGSRGVGKTSAARILAKCLNCDKGPTPEPCNDCSSCREIDDGRSLDVYEIDGASNTSVDDIRELRENIKYLPRPGKRRVYIIDEVHMLSKSAFNALLKTLEEPPEHVVFIFATTEPHKVPETIQSRCQRFDFRRIPRAKILERLQVMAQEEGYEIDERALSAVAKAADGSMRDAQSLLDQIISYCGPSVPGEAVAEILGIAGVEGNGQSELVRSLVGLLPSTGTVLLDGKDVAQLSTRERRDAGVGYISEDRQKDGLVLAFTLWENAALGHHHVPPFAKGPWLDIAGAKARTDEIVEEFDVRTPGINVPAFTLSGGNQQKLVVGREMTAEPKVLVAAHPTRGVDVGAQAVIWDILRDARAAGLGTILVSADLEELIGLSDRLLVMLRGEIVAEVDPSTVTPAELGSYMTGAKTGAH